MITTPPAAPPDTPLAAVTTWHWWAGIAAIVTALALHALSSAYLPRYE